MKSINHGQQSLVSLVSIVSMVSSIPSKTCDLSTQRIEKIAYICTTRTTREFREKVEDNFFLQKEPCLISDKDFQTGICPTYCHLLLPTITYHPPPTASLSYTYSNQLIAVQPISTYHNHPQNNLEIGEKIHSKNLSS